MAVSGADIVNRARKELGDPYVWGAEGPNSFDCSGLVQYVFGKFGIKTPRVASDQAGYGKKIGRKDLQPGDLIFFNWTGKPHGHVGIYAGSNKLIHAPNSTTVVKEVTMTSSMWSHVDAYRRFPGVVGGPATSEGDSDVLHRIGDALVPDSITAAVKGVGDRLGDIAGSLASVGKVAELVTKAFLPSNMLRGASALAGSLFVLIGIYFLSREVRNS